MPPTLERARVEGGCRGARGARGGWRVAPFIAAIRVYQVTLGVFLGGHCRFVPSCSNYALEALQSHGALRGTWLTVRRLLRCHPWGPHGSDPVPQRKAR